MYHVKTYKKILLHDLNPIGSQPFLIYCWIYYSFGDFPMLCFRELLLEVLSDQLYFWFVLSQNLPNEKESKAFVWVQLWGHGVSYEQISRKKEKAHNFNVHGPIFTKLHLFFNSPSLKATTCQYHFIIRVPPTDERKWHVLDFYVLLQAGSTSNLVK